MRMDLSKNDGRTAMQEYGKYNKCKWDMRFKPNHLNTPIAIAMIRIINRPFVNKQLKYQRLLMEMPCKIILDFPANRTPIG